MDSVFVLHDIWVFSWEDPKLGVTQWLGVTHYLECNQVINHLGFGDGQGGLAYCDSWGRKESDTTERLN